MSHSSRAKAANKLLAAELLEEARPLLARRRALLTASAALGDTASVPAAIEVLRAWHGPADIRDEAIRIVTDLRRAIGTP